MEAIQMGYQSDEIKGHMPPIATVWSALKKIEQDGMLVTLGAVDDTGALLGYAIYLLFDHMHHRGVMFGACDILAVDKECRGVGIAKALVERAEIVLRELGVNYMTHGFRHVYKDKTPLFEKLGFKAEETTYIKEL